MTGRSKPPIPVNVIAGPLGVGKTTAINHLLSLRPEHEKWAVLINEYGQIGLDAALMERAREPGADVDVREVAGGCICCSVSFFFEASLVLLLKRRPDRLLIEPTGLATVSGILDTLALPGIGKSVDVRSIITLLDPTMDHRDALRVEAEDQIEAADILLANRSDLATPEQLESFDRWASALFPAKRHVAHIQRGQISLELLDRVRQRRVAGEGLDEEAKQRLEAHSRETAGHGHDHHHDHHHDHSHEAPQPLVCGPEQPIVRRQHDTELAFTIGWALWVDSVFDAKSTSEWLAALRERPEVRRLKGVLNTTEGWLSLNFVDGEGDINPSGYRRDSRVELVWVGDSRPDADALERDLLACLVSEPT